MLHRHQSLSPTLAQVYKLAPADRDAHTDTDLSAMTETSVAGVRSDVKKVIEASVCSRSVVRDAALSWRSAGRAGGGGSNDGNPVAWLQPSAYGGERRHHPVRATCLIGAGRQGQSILKQCERFQFSNLRSVVFAPNVVLIFTPTQCCNGANGETLPAKLCLCN